MKARDLIPGWPKPRSTSSLMANRWPAVVYTAAIDLYTLQMNRRYGVINEAEYERELNEIEAALREIRQRQCEIQDDREYHAQQQAMVDEFRRRKLTTSSACDVDLGLWCHRLLEQPMWGEMKIVTNRSE